MPPAQRVSITYSQTRDIGVDQIVRLYRECGWSAADRPQQLRDALIDSHTLVSAWDSDTLVGIGNAISDGHLVVYCRPQRIRLTSATPA